MSNNTHVPYHTTILRPLSPPRATPVRYVREKKETERKCKERRNSRFRTLFSTLPNKLAPLKNATVADRSHVSSTGTTCIHVDRTNLAVLVDGAHPCPARSGLEAALMLCDALALPCFPAVNTFATETSGT
ncbi:unnamed protein product [Scytosiphon promiscuus]